MGRYRARDLLLLPSLLSLTRLPLGMAFLQAASRPAWALLILAVAGATDVLDGFVARRRGQATPTGAVLDGVLDKLFAGIVVGGLVAQGRLPLGGALLLAARELGELPLVLWWIVRRDGRRAREPRAHWLGKATTVVQFLAIAAVLSREEVPTAWLAAAAVLGAAAAVAYWRRELGSARERGEAPE